MAKLKTWHTYWCLWWQTSYHHHCLQHAIKPVGMDFQVISSNFPGSKQLYLCILRNKYGYQIRNAMEKKNSVWPGRNAKMAWYSIHIGFWMCQFQWNRFWGCTFRCFQVMGYMFALSLKLLIIGLLMEYFATFLKRLHWKNSHKMFHISSLIVFLSNGKVKDMFFGDKDQISSEECKRKGKREV